MKMVFLESRSLGDDMDLSCFQQYGDLEIYESSSVEEARERVKDADVVFTNKLMMDASTLETAEKLNYIGVTATGTNNIDRAYCKERGFTVTNVAGYSTESVAQHTFAILFYLLEKLRYFDDFVKQGEYAASDLFTHFGEKFFELSGKTWGIIGLGAIGRRVAQIAEAFGCKVIYYSASGKNQHPKYRQVDLDTLLQNSDIVSVHAPLNEKTEQLMNYEAFSKMKRSAYFINVGRGPIVCEEDLVKALQEDLIAGAGLDVMSVEPICEDNPLLTMKDSRKLLLTPHMAWASVEARTRLIRELQRNLEAWIKGEERNCIKL